MSCAGRIVMWSSVGMALLAGGTLNAAELIGKVVDVTGGPVHNTTIELRKDGGPEVIRTFFTDNSGFFRFTDLDVGAYEISFKCQGFRLTTIKCTVSQDERVSLPEVELQLAPIESCKQPDPGPPDIEVVFNDIDGATELTGRVGERDGTPIRGAVAILTNGTNSYRIFSGRDGVFQFSNLKPGKYQLRVLHNGFIEFVVDEVEIRDRHTTDIQDSLILPRCPSNLNCQPVRKTEKVRLCL